MQLLIDIDGVLKNGDNIFPEAEGFLKKINASEKVGACLLSNSTVFDGQTAIDFLQGKIGALHNITAITAIDVAKAYASKFKSYKFIGNKAAEPYFDSCSSDTPEAIIIGDLGLDWNAEIMNKIFRYAMNGTELVALQMNKYGIKQEDIQLDAGAYISGIAYACDQNPTLIGKPSQQFFKTAIEKTKNTEGPLFMIGDDLTGDIQGGQNAGATACLVMTGKTNEQILNKSSVRPDLIFNNLDELGQYFDEKELW